MTIQDTLVNEQPLVSIIIPCYNSEKYIEKCIESIINQSYEHIEIVIVDDGSTDNTVEILKTYKNVRVYSQVNSGACVARNYGLTKCKGYYVKFLDSDDFLNTDSISLQVDFAESLQDMQIAYGYKEVLFNDKISIDKEILDSTNQFRQLINRNIVTTLPLHKRKVLLETGAFDEQLKFRQEWDLHLKLAKNGHTFIYHDTSIYTQVMHDNPNRISARKLNVSKEIENLDYIRSKYDSNEENNVAWAHKYWNLGRQFLKLKRKKDADSIFLIARDISPHNYLSMYPKFYQLAVRYAGPLLSEKLVRLYTSYKGDS
ncbi:glycosyltransferase family 2 protein [Psychrobacter pacificensis]|uniref:glycosyltransferase family 2 protein n=1 Tax=Psychrobacter pacificensis TaxID=112002 RepID=UPI003CFF6B65